MDRSPVIVKPPRPKSEEESLPPKKVLQVFVWYDESHLMGIAKYARQVGWTLELLPVKKVDLLTKGNFDGLICQLHEDAQDLVAAVKALDVPKVELAGWVKDLNVPSVEPDYREAARMVGRHFLERGFRNFALLCTYADSKYSREIMAGLRDILEPLGFPLHVINLFPDEEPSVYDSDNLQPVLNRMTPIIEERITKDLLLLPKPLAVLTQDWSHMYTLAESCRSLDLMIPEQVAAATSFISRPDEYSLLPVTMTGFDFDLEEQGYQAAALLDRLMRGEPPPRTPIFIPPKELVVGESSNTYAVENVDVARALTFIRRNIHRKDLFAPEVVSACNVSRSVLYREFQKHVGRPIAAEIDAQRCGKAMHLLATTSLTAVETAEACGYHDAHHLRRSIKRATGMTPMEYRDSATRKSSE